MARAKQKKYTVSVVNPSARRRRKKTSTRKKKATRRRKTTTRKKTPSKRTPKKMARRKRRTTTRRKPTRRRAPARRRTTRRNPTRARRVASRVRRGFKIDPMEPFTRELFARLAGKVFAVWAVKRWGSAAEGPNSPTTGNNWTWNNYLISLASGFIGGEIMGRIGWQRAGRNFYRGAADMTATKFMWSEVIMRWPALAGGGYVQSALGQAGTSRGYPAFGGGYPSFGNVDGQVSQLFAQTQPGDIVDDGRGNRWLNRGGRMVAMMGADMGADIVEAGPLGAEIVEAGPLGSMVEAGPLGHMMPAAATRSDEIAGAYTFRGSKDPYRSAYM
jgi:hypothetical protein